MKHPVLAAISSAAVMLLSACAQPAPPIPSTANMRDLELDDQPARLQCARGKVPMCTVRERNDARGRVRETICWCGII